MSDRPSAHRSAADVLADWRDAERRIEQEPSGTSARHRARVETAAFADEYQTLVAELNNEAHDLAASRPVISPPAASEPGQIRRIDGGSVAQSTE